MAKKTEADPSLISILGSLTAPQAWTLALAIVAVIGGTFSLGGLYESVKQERVLFAKDEQLSMQRTQKDEQISTLKTQNDRLDESLKQLSKALKDDLQDKAGVVAKSEFLTRLVYFLENGDDTSQKLLVDVACSMWKQSEGKRISVGQGPINEINLDDFQHGLSQDMEEFLVLQGVDRTLLGSIRQDFAAAGSAFSVQKIPPTLSRAIATVQKQSSQTKLIKTVTFSDGSKFDLPEQIAVAVHNRQSCSPIPP